MPLCRCSWVFIPASARLWPRAVWLGRRKLLQICKSWQIKELAIPGLWPWSGRLFVHLDLESSTTTAVTRVVGAVLASKWQHVMEANGTIQSIPRFCESISVKRNGDLVKGLR